MNYFTINLILTAVFLFTCSDFLYASGACEEPTYPDQASFEPEPSPETCAGRWVKMAVSNGECPVKLTNCGDAVRGETNTCISGRYKIEESWTADAPNCTYFWLGPCTETQVLETIEFLCANNTFYRESCGFTPPAGFTQCDNGLPKYYKWDGEYAVMVSGSRANDSSGPNRFQAWQWECD